MTDPKALITELDAELAAAAKLQNRARRIVDRVLPLLQTRHGWHDPHGFIEASARRGDRSFLYHVVWARLRAKRDGGLPRIHMPKGSERALAGTSMERASRYLEVTYAS